MTKYKKYKRAFNIACELLCGDYLYGYDKDTIFKEIIGKEGFVCHDLVENFILEHIDELRGVDSEAINMTDEEKDNSWIFEIFNKDMIEAKTEQWTKEAEEAGMTLTEYLESISPLGGE